MMLILLITVLIGVQKEKGRIRFIKYDELVTSGLQKTKMAENVQLEPSAGKVTMATSIFSMTYYP